MPINNSTILVGATGVTISGGTAHTMIADSKSVPQGIHVVDSTVTDFATRPHSTFSASASPVSRDGVYEKGKWNVSHVRPKLVSTGAYVGNVGRIALELHPETTAAELLEMKLQLVQCIMDSDFNDFWNLQSVS